MPISKDKFQTIDEDGPSLPDLSPDTTQGAVYRFLVEHADQAFRQRELVDAIDVPAGSIGPTLNRLEQHGLVDHRDQFWAITVISFGRLQMPNMPSPRLASTVLRQPTISMADSRMKTSTPGWRQQSTPLTVS